MTAKATILEYLDDSQLLGGSFSAESWNAHKCRMAAIYALPIPDMDLFVECTGRTRPLERPAAMSVLVKGRQLGGSHITTAEVIYRATAFDYSPYVAAGERTYIPLIFPTRRQSRIYHDYLTGQLAKSPMLSNMVASRTKFTIELTNSVIIETGTADQINLRGYFIPWYGIDEGAWLPGAGAAHSDQAIHDSIAPAGARYPLRGASIVSSPRGAFGLVYEMYSKHFGNDDSDVLVWHAPTWVMNPTIPVEYFDKVRRENPVMFATEYGAQFCSSLSAMFEREWLEACLCLPDKSKPRSEHLDWPYVGFCDLSGAKVDAGTLAVAHVTPGTDVIIVDFMRRWKAPYSPENVVEEMVGHLRDYGLSVVTGDNYAGSLVSELFEKRGVHYRVSDLNRSEIYLECGSLFATNRIEAPANDWLMMELASMERTVKSGGRDKVDHPPGGTDDLANSVCGAAIYAWRARSQSFEIVTGPLMQTAKADYALSDGDTDSWPSLL